MTDERVPSGLDAWRLGGAVLLAGDASTRRYLRARRPDGGSVVVMDCGAPFEGQLPFSRWQRFYSGLGIRVPAILDEDPPRGLVLLEDLGDDLLQGRVEDSGPGACEAAYARSVEWGRRLAEGGTPLFDSAVEPDDDPLTPARLGLEMDLFLVHAAGLDVEPPEAGPPLQRASRALDEASGAALEARALLRRLCEDVHEAAGGTGSMVLCHRDYHARNLLLVPSGPAEDVAVIDFQDTRRGPRAYDVASLACDPYVTLPESMASRLVAAWRPGGVAGEDWGREVALAAAQRLLKAAGTYAFMTRERRRGEYARWLRPALDRARTQLSSWPHADDLWSALGRCGVAIAAS